MVSGQPYCLSGANIMTEGSSLRFYAECPKEPIQNAHFTAKIPTCEVPGEIHASLALWLPFIVGIRDINQCR